jgi:hypothetical protein
MATLSVGGTTVFDGSALQSGVTGALTTGVTFPAGHIIQTVMSSPFTTTESTTSTSGVDTSVFSIITPLKNNSKILVFGSIAVGVNTGGAYGGSVWMSRSQAGGETDTIIIVGDGDGVRTRGTGGIYSDSINYQQFIIPTCYLDSPTIPTTPVAITYRYKFKSGWASPNGIYINRGGADSNSASFTRVSSYITLIEVAG